MRPLTSPRRDGFALAFASLFPLAMAYLYFVVLHNDAGGTDPVFLAAFGIGKAIQFGFPIAYLYCFDRGLLRLTKPPLGGTMMGAGFGLLVGVAMFVLYFTAIQHIAAVTEDTPRKIFSRLEQFGKATPFGYLQLALYVSVLHSLLEEYYWRWFVFGRMRRHVPLALAIVLSSVAFMLHHIMILGVYFPGHLWTLAMPLSICVAVGGGVWAWIYDRTGSLVAAWVSHAIIDASIMGLGYWMLRELLCATPQAGG